MNLAYRNMTLEDAVNITTLNAAVVDVTSPMSTAHFTTLFGLSTLRLVAEANDTTVGFVLAIPDGKAYDNGNYRWFSGHLESFLYIDRVVVAEKCRGLGIGRLLYSRIYDAAVQAGVSNICAEMDLEPPNTVSLRFHNKAGFIQLGTRVLDSGKRVSMQTRVVAPKNPQQ